MICNLLRPQHKVEVETDKKTSTGKRYRVNNRPSLMEMAVHVFWACDVSLVWGLLLSAHSL